VKAPEAGHWVEVGEHECAEYLSNGAHLEQHRPDRLAAREILRGDATVEGHQFDHAADEREPKKRVAATASGDDRPVARSGVSGKKIGPCNVNRTAYRYTVAAAL
jgi:hypothetical protein